MKTIKNNCAILKFVFKFCPKLVVSSIIYIMSNVTLAVSKVLIIQKAINLVINGASIEKLINSLLYFILIIVITSIIKIIYNRYINPKYSLIYTKKMQRFMYSKVKTIDMESFDNPDFYDKYSRALREGVWRGRLIYQELVKFISATTTSIAIGAVIILTDVYLLLIILVSSILNVIIITMVNKKWYLFSKETENQQRMYHYVNRTFYRQKLASEIKTTPVSDLLIEKYQDSAKIINKKFKKTQKQVNSLLMLSSFTNQMLSQGLSYIYLGYKLFKRIFDVDIFTSTLNATLQFSSNFTDSINILIALKNYAFYIEDFLWLVEYKPKVERKNGEKIGEVEKLSVNDLAFKYPGIEEFSLEEITLSIKKGKKIALVGHNGSGKTTLMKLLLNFYNPLSGNISINDKSYELLNINSIREKYAIVFQDFQIYALTIGENVLMRRVRNKEDEKQVIEALRSVGLLEKVMSFPKGIYTHMTREFDRDGAVFSGGQLQRLAIARVFASDADVYILDEPTSSLDPFSEERINKLIIKNSKKAMIIIAHRLSTVVDVDEIFLLDHGKIIEKGTHEELMKANGIYANMFNTQKSLYVKH